jgi:hypothetical protein
MYHYDDKYTKTSEYTGHKSDKSKKKTKYIKSKPNHPDWRGVGKLPMGLSKEELHEISKQS